MNREEIIKYIQKIEDEAYERYLEAENLSSEEEYRRGEKWRLLSQIKFAIITGITG